MQTDDIRHCVPADGYLDYFRREAFFAEVPRGTTIQLSALASNIAKPRTFPLNSTPTIFVRGVRVGDKDYCTVQVHIEWQKRNNLWKLPFVIFGIAAAAYVAIVLRRRQTGKGETYFDVSLTRRCT